MGGGVRSCGGAGGATGASRASVTVRNALGMRVQLRWGLLAPGHGHDEELCPLLSQSGSLGGQGEETPEKFNVAISGEG